jgi:hypothetical protein
MVWLSRYTTIANELVNRLALISAIKPCIHMPPAFLDMACLIGVMSFLSHYDLVMSISPVSRYYSLVANQPILWKVNVASTSVTVSANLSNLWANISGYADRNLRLTKMFTIGRTSLLPSTICVVYDIASKRRPLASALNQFIPSPRTGTLTNLSIKHCKLSYQ